MQSRFGRLATSLVLGCLLIGSIHTHAEIVEEIVAWIDGDIITRSDLDAAEQALVATLYREYTGAELDRRVQEQRAEVLQQLIDRQILIHRAGRFFDLDALGDSVVEMVMEQQGIETEEELDQMLTQQGLTREQFKTQMVFSFAPEEVIRMEVGRRVAVGDAAVEAYYNEHESDYLVPAKVTLREIVLLAEDGDREAKRTQAQRLYERAVEPGADFEALALVYSEAGTKDGGGLLGPLDVGDLSDDLATIAVETPVGEVSGPHDMPYGFHIILIVERTDEQQRTLEEVREEIRLQLENREYEERLEAFLVQCRSEADWEVSKKYADSGRYRIAE